ncbi:zinc finger protein 532-like isoform X2 [Aricia agestis]|uniref:zinc finger protein 532-like isoform X2 n=1 Tax=Aricia agestis TaxID=91739 RepID=UPI001C2024F3|nr:zinc finger protein 532-like isoform X2 [Aricia agestis]
MYDVQIMCTIVVMANDKLSIKHLLFTKALPNYIPNVTGHKTYLCTDCGDKFIFESSLNTHVNRKSMKITYMCRHCSQLKIFFNRCKLLSHIRSHSFKTATINVSDLNVEPLPLEHYTIPPAITGQENEKSKVPENTSTTSTNFCPDCKKQINVTGIFYQDRANHYMKLSDDMTCYSCPVCLYSLPTTCALQAHLRIHLGKPPYICPECGVTLPQKGTIYPFNHDCEGFKTMRVTTRLKCLKKNCKIFHPNEYRDHMKKHIKKMFRCKSCPSIWCNEQEKEKHLNCKGQEYIECYKCPICPNKFVSGAKLDRHLSGHFNSNMNIILESQVYPCRLCSNVFDQVKGLLTHHINEHGASKTLIGNLLLTSTIQNKEMCVVVKRCEKCHRNFKYRCPFDQIKTLPNECPFRCSSVKVKCFVCKIAINEQWENIKRHVKALHKEHKCVDVTVNLKRLKPDTIKRYRNPAKKFKSAFLNNSAIFKCNMCEQNFVSKNELELHIVSHRDLGMAYQCLECGQSFAVKPSFSTHLKMIHKISDVDIYISKKQCFNEMAFSKSQKNDNPVNNEPVQENQCKICREQFGDNIALEKHFRVHGMAFLKENINKSPN